MGLYFANKHNNMLSWHALKRVGGNLWVDEGKIGEVFLMLLNRGGCEDLQEVHLRVVPLDKKQQQRMAVVTASCCFC
jgi:hypothetical protein